jgi:diadenosine tetraphosphatase ApaH/serine/threonine PP2A family protein phosphatase
VIADVVITGHTHLPFMRDYRQIHIVNPGSAGQPLDGDPRAAYATWEDGSLELHRVSYDQTPLLHAIGNLPLEPHLIEDLSNIIRHGSIQLQGNPRSAQCR